MERLIRQRGETRLAVEGLLRQLRIRPSAMLARSTEQQIEIIRDYNNQLISRGQTFEDQSDVWDFIAEASEELEEYDRERRNAMERPAKRLKAESDPTFSGDILDYDRYRAALIDLIMENDEIDDETKTRRIYNGLDKELQQSLGSYRKFQADPQYLLQVLDRRFNDGSQAAAQWIKEIQAIAPVGRYAQTSSWQKLLNVVSGVRTVEMETYFESQIIDAIKEKLSTSSCHELNKNYPRSIGGLFQYLETEVESHRLEEIRQRDKPHAQSKPLAQPSTRFQPRHGIKRKYPGDNHKTTDQIYLVQQGCVFCKKKDHESANCPLAINQRYQRAEVAGLCYRCLMHLHEDKPDCNAICARCNRGKHHEWLCRFEKAGPQVILHSTAQIFLSTIIAKVSYEGRSVWARVLLDNGGTRTIIDRRLVDALGGKTTAAAPIALSGIGASDTGTSRCVTVCLGAMDRGFRYYLDPWVVDQITRVPTEVPSMQVLKFVSDKKISITEKRTAETPFTKYIMMIIGNDFGEAFRTNNRVPLGSLFSAYETKLGWMICGNTKDLMLHLTDQSNVQETSEDEETRCVYDELKHIFDYTEPEPEDVTIEIRYNPVKRRYYVRLPVMCLEGLDDNRQSALHQATHLRLRLERSGQLDEYHRTMSAYLSEDHAEAIPIFPYEVDADSEGELEPAELTGDERSCNKVSYIPHLPVFKKGASKTQCRAVFNAAAHRKTHKSLNQCLYKGTVVHCDLLKSLLRVRMAPILLTTDLKKAFLQIRIDPRDRDLLRYFWFRNINEERPTAFRMKALLFGAICSPSILGAVVDHHLEQCQNQYPETVTELKEGLYVDDAALAANSRERAVRMISETSEIFKRASFELHDWSTSDAKLVDAKEIRDTVTCEDQTQNCLGMLWNPRRDELSFKIDSFNLPEHPTRRHALKTLARLYDPLGLVLPFTMNIRWYLRELAMDTKYWDMPLNDAQRDKVIEFDKQMRSLLTLRIPRTIQSSGHFELHVYCDANLVGLGSVIYIREASSCKQMLLCAKGKLAPKKASTVPRMELCAALIGAELMDAVTKKTAATFQGIFMYSDSQVTLHRIGNDANRYQPYVARRISKLQEITGGRSEWAYVSSAQNPADLITKGSTVPALIQNRLWWAGRQLCRDKVPAEEWQDEELLEPTMFEPEEVLPLAYLLDGDLDAARDHFRRDLEAISTQGMEAINAGRERRLSKESLVNLRVWQLLQRHQFKAELDILGQKKPLRKRSKLSKWNPFIDEWNVLRARRRLEYAQIDYDVIYPIILNMHPWVKQLISETHERLNHPGSNRTFDEVNRFFLIFKLRKSVYSHTYRCQTCNRNRGQAFRVNPPPLPRFRVSEAKPFRMLGVDYFGPITTLDGKQIFGLIFSCAVTRAVHIEWVPDLTAEYCFMALQRVFNLYGIPVEVHSDNGTSFKRTHRKLAAVIGLLEQRAPEQFKRCE